MTVAAPFPSEELRQVVSTGEERVDRGAAYREENAHECEEQPDLAERDFDTEGDRAQELGLQPFVEKKSAAPTIINANERKPPSP